MKFQFSIPESEIGKTKTFLTSTFARLQAPVQNSMAARYQQIVRRNFGFTGIDRPRKWALLSPSYARRVHRKVATLHVTGALKAAVKTENTSGSKPARVFASNADVPYALAHQYGNPKNNLPARPYFPMKSDGTPTPYTRAEMEKIAERETKNKL